MGAGDTRRGGGARSSHTPCQTEPGRLQGRPWFIMETETPGSPLSSRCRSVSVCSPGCRYGHTSSHTRALFWGCSRAPARGSDTRGICLLYSTHHPALSMTSNLAACPGAGMKCHPAQGPAHRLPQAALLPEEELGKLQANGKGGDTHPPCLLLMPPRSLDREFPKGSPSGKCDQQISLLLGHTPTPPA